MQNRPFVEFDLFAPQDIAPWMGRSGDDPHLTGTQLSQASVWLNVGAQTLLEYSPAIQAHWKMEERFADQMLGQLRGDLLAALGVALQPVPDDLLGWLQPQTAQPGARWSALTGRVWDGKGASSVDCSLLAGTICDAFARRSLPLDRLRASPDIWFWSSESHVFVGWDKRGLDIDGLPVWTATHGTQSFARGDFVAQIEDFEERYFAAMTRQFEKVRAGALERTIQVDPDRDERHLREERAESPVPAFATAVRERPVDWDAVRTALRQTVAITGFEPD